MAQTITAVVGNTIAAAEAIAQTGVGRILLYNLPAPEFLPVPLPPAFAQVVDAHNAALAQGAAFLASQEIDAEIVDMHRIGDEIGGDPRTFGLNPAYLDQPLLLGIGSQPIWDPEAQNWVIEANPAVAGVDENRIAFMDLLHPSSATHGVLGAFAAASIADNLVFLGPEDDVRWTGPLDDLVLAGGGNDRIFAQGGDDTVLAGLGDDVIFGDERAATSSPGAPATTGCTAALGNDVVAGSDGDDLQNGGAGRDLMVDGLGHDLLRRRGPRRFPLHPRRRCSAGRTRTTAACSSAARHRHPLPRGRRRDPGGDRGRAEAGARAAARRRSGSATRSIERYVFVDPADPGRRHRHPRGSTRPTSGASSEPRQAM